jgi:DNA-binding PadR family transcriptional regulator
MTEPDALTTTSYAILGQLALRSWSTYELAREMRRNLHYFWPRAESRIYAEVKRLADRGLVVAAHSFVGRRRRTTYAITPAGRDALAGWLATPARPYALEFEGLLRVLLGRFGTTEQLLAAVRAAGEQAGELLGMGDRIAREYAEGRAPFQDEIETRAFVFDFLYGFAVTVRDWAERTEHELAEARTLAGEQRVARSLAVIDRARDRSRR